MSNVLPFRRAVPARKPAALPGRIQPWTGFLLVSVALAAIFLILGKLNAHRATDAPLRQAVRLSVVDGDSLKRGTESIRLYNIDAPERDQTCRDENNRVWPCGRAAQRRLAELTAKGEVSCTSRGRDRYGRTLATCTARDVGDLGETLVREGYAVSYGDVSGRYASAEAEARAARRGLWRGTFQRPQDWRREHPRRG